MDNRGYISYRHFDKPEKPPKVIDWRSGIPESTKDAILTQELTRRLLNTQIELPLGQREEVINNFSDRMANSNYPEDRIEKIVVRTLIGFERRLKTNLDENKQHNRSKKMLKSNLVIVKQNRLICK